jgi:hypothetical protein
MAKHMFHAHRYFQSNHTKLRKAHIPTLFDSPKSFSECTQMLLKYQQHTKFLKSGSYFLLSTKISLLVIIIIIIIMFVKG